MAHVSRVFFTFISLYGTIFTRQKLQCHEERSGLSRCAGVISGLFNLKGTAIGGKATLSWAKQEFNPDVAIMDSLDIIAKVGAAMLGLPGVNIHSGPTFEPLFTSPSPGTGRRAHAHQDPRFVPMLLAPYTSPMVCSLAFSRPIVL